MAKGQKPINYIDNLPDGVKPVFGTIDVFVDREGNIYGREIRKIKNRWNGSLSNHKYFGKFFKYAQHKNKRNGYMYCTIRYYSGNVTRRVHRIVAETFISNPDGHKVVGHKNNIKCDDRVENLYWTTYSENTKKAVDDGLLVNDCGYADSQSKPVNMYETATNKLLGSYGSIHEAVRLTGLPMTTISRQCKYKRPVRKPYYFRYQSDVR